MKLSKKPLPIMVFFVLLILVIPVGMGIFFSVNHNGVVAKQSVPVGQSQEQVKWSKIATLIGQCQIVWLDADPANPSAQIKNGATVKIIDPPSFVTMQQLVQAVSSTCGIISVGSGMIP